MKNNRVWFRFILFYTEVAPTDPWCNISRLYLDGKNMRRHCQIKNLHASGIFTLSESERLTNLQKLQLKKLFLQCVFYTCNLLRWMFFNPCDNWKTLFLIKVCRYFDIFSKAILLISLKQVF